MRNLFASEWRCISNLIMMQWRTIPQNAPSVLNEYTVRLSNGKMLRQFNCDFSLDFVEPQSDSSDHVATMSPILPNTLGAEVFLVVKKHTFEPMRLELIGGQAFSAADFRDYLAEVEAAITQSVEESGFLRRFPELSRQYVIESVRPQKMKDSRVLVVGNEICFLYCSEDTIPTVRGERVEFAKADDKEIVYYVANSHISCVDGWVRTDVKTLDWKLVALPT